MTSRVRTIAVAALAGAVLLAVTGCTQSEVGNEYVPADGANADNDAVGLRNMLLVSDGRVYSALAGTIINKTEVKDQLTGIGVRGPSGTTVPFNRDTINVAPRGAVFLGGREPGDNRQQAIRLNQGAPAGVFITLVFSFSKAGDIAVQTPVVPAVGEYAQTLVQATPKPLVTKVAEALATP